MIKVSVIVPVYKVPLDYLRECFDSFLAQTMQECEFIIVSDGAPDAECSVCEEYADKDSRFKFFRREHAGVSTTRNFGISQAQGDYITFVDSDDWIEEDCCLKIYNHAIKNQSDIVFWDLSFSEVEGTSSTAFFERDLNQLNSLEKMQYIEGTIFAIDRKHLVPCLSVCKLYKTSIITENQIFFDTELRFGEDRVFNYQISNIAENISYINKSFYNYRIHQSSATQTFRKREFNNHLTYIFRLSEILDVNGSNALSNETICSYYGCIAKVYSSGLSYTEKLDELYYLKAYVKNEEFNILIQHSTTALNKLSFALEIFLMKRKISWLFSLRILKFRLHHLLHASF